MKVLLFVEALNESGCTDAALRHMSKSDREKYTNRDISDRQKEVKTAVWAAEAAAIQADAWPDDCVNGSPRLSFRKPMAMYSQHRYILLHLREIW